MTSYKISVIGEGKNKMKQHPIFANVKNYNFSNYNFSNFFFFFFFKKNVIQTFD